MLLFIFTVRKCKPLALVIGLGGLLILLFPGIARAQSAGEAEALIARTIAKGFKMPRSVPDCQSFLVTVIVPVTDNRTGECMTFSENCPPELRVELQKSILKVNGTTFSEALGLGKSGKPYKMLIPFVFYSDEACTETLTADQYRQLMRDGLSLPPGSGPVHFISAFFIGSGRPMP